MESLLEQHFNLVELLDNEAFDKKLSHYFEEC